MVHDLRELALAVRARAGVAARHHRIGEVDRRLARRADVDDARRRGALQQRHQLAGQQVVRQVVHREPQLDAVVALGAVAGRHRAADAGVVDQDVEPRLARAPRGRARGPRRATRIGEVDPRRGGAGRAQLAARASARAGSRPCTSTVAWRVASASATPRPSPSVAPVMSTVSPTRSVMRLRHPLCDETAAPHAPDGSVSGGDAYHIGATDRRSIPLQAPTGLTALGASRFVDRVGWCPAGLKPNSRLRRGRRSRAARTARSPRVAGVGIEPDRRVAVGAARTPRSSPSRAAEAGALARRIDHQRVDDQRRLGARATRSARTRATAPAVEDHRADGRVAVVEQEQVAPSRPHRPRSLGSGRSVVPLPDAALEHRLGAATIHREHGVDIWLGGGDQRQGVVPSIDHCRQGNEGGDHRPGPVGFRAPAGPRIRYDAADEVRHARRVRDRGAGGGAPRGGGAGQPAAAIALIAKPSVVRVWGAYVAVYELGAAKFQESIGGSGTGFFITERRLHRDQRARRDRHPRRRRQGQGARCSARCSPSSSGSSAPSSRR